MSYCSRKLFAACESKNEYSKTVWYQERYVKQDEKIYDIPCNSSPEPETISKPKFEFDKLRSNFETGFQNSDTEKTVTQNNDFQTIDKGINTKQTETNETLVKPVPLKPKPVLVKMASDSKMCKSSENLSEEFRTARRNIERKIATESRRYQKKERNATALNSGIGLCIAKRDRKDQLDVDRENLNRLMNEIYETVSAACRMDEQRPSKFPTEADSTSEDSIKLTRSLTEKRKNYVRRVSSRAACLDPKSRTRFRHQTSICSYKSETLENNPYSTFRSWKSFRTSQNNVNKMADVDRRDSTDSKFNLTDSSGNLLSMKGDLDLSMDNLSLDDKAGCLDIQLPFEPRERGLFDVCLLVGLNYMTGQAYVKSVFPSQVSVPPHIENLIFPETLNAEATDYEQAAEHNQTYSLVLTDEKGERNYGYCRRVLPEGAACCLPLCYCIIGRYRAPGFYYKVLKEIESHHGSSEIEMNVVLQQLFETDFPNPGEEITLQYTPKNLTLTDLTRSKTLPDQRRSESVKTNSVSECYDVENNNSVKKVLVSVQSVRMNLLKRPIEPRVDEGGLSVLLDTLGAGLLIKVFGSLLLERKVVLISDSLSQLSGCMEGLQQILYPFVWQQPLISVVPEELRREVLEAPLPILAGCLRGGNNEDLGFEEGMLIDITGDSAKVLCFQGDEATILPAGCYKTLKTTLQMESSRNMQKVDREDVRTRNVFISEAFLRFFMSVLAQFHRHFVEREILEGELGKAGVVFEKEAFLKSASSKQQQYFLEWFTETAMFNHFIQNMAVCYKYRDAPSSGQPLDYSTIEGIVDAPLPNFYELFEERLTRNTKKNSTKSLENNSKSNYKSAMNKKVKLLKSKLRDLVT
ncbi:DENN domain-containing protein 2A isoform X2 [Plutella xylostella]|uniref:DENN domain-containing protein 2A isoform X2 n=1 Tax=Plutella xylostella TaxID=51655 RepID=UPI002032B993|nr:DENN domain-containing protein 2A isoform X2 [Plutella xylostella]